MLTLRSGFALFAGLASVMLCVFWALEGSVAVHSAAGPLSRPSLLDADVPSSVVTADDGDSRVSAGDRALNGNDARMCFRCIDACSRRILAGVDVRLTCLATGMTRVTTSSSEGVAAIAWTLHGAEDVMVEAHVAGYVRLRGTMPTSTSVQTLALEPGGNLEVRVRSADGKPVAGMSLAILPPLPSVSWSSDWQEVLIKMQSEPGSTPLSFDATMKAWRSAVPAQSLTNALRDAVRSSDDEGMVCWRDLLPNASYRFAITSAVETALEPAHERRRLRVIGEAVEVGASPPAGVSGAIEVVAGRVSNGIASLLPTTSVRGRFPSRAAAGVSVKLSRISIATADGKDRASTIDPLATCTAEDDGRFHFSDLGEGVYLVRACWLPAQNQVQFASRAFRIEATREDGLDAVDLGDIQPTNGAALTVDVRCVDEQGSSLSVERVFERGDLASVLLHLRTQPDDRLFDHTLFETIVLSLDTPLTLLGLPPGSLRLEASPYGGNRWSDVIELEAAKHESRVGAHERVALALCVRRGVPCVLHVVDAHGRAKAASTVQLRHVATGRVATADTIDGAARCRVTLLAGEHEVWARGAVSVADEVGDCWLGTLVVASDTTEVRLQLGPAAAVRGVVRDALGQPLGHADLNWSLPTKVRSAAAAIVVGARTDADGRFKLAGLPPGVELRGSHVTLGPLTPGWNEVQVDLTARR